MKTIIENILTTAQAARDAGQTIRIERTLPAIEINRGEDDVFAFQEHEAEALLEQAKELILDLEELAETQLSVEDVLLSQAQGW